MPSILIPIILGLVKGQSIGALLGALTGSDWLTLAEGVAGELVPELAAKLGLAHPSLAELVKQISDGVLPPLAAKAAQDVLAANADEAMKLQPGMGTNY